jgi:hypothetical protein
MLAKFDEVELWHQKLVHVNYKLIETLSTTGGVRGLPTLSMIVKAVCASCQNGKRIRAPHKKVQQIVTASILVLVHMDLFGSTQIESIGRKWFVMVCVDDYARFTWLHFMNKKSDAFEAFQKLYLNV